MINIVSSTLRQTNFDCVDYSQFFRSLNCLTLQSGIKPTHGLFYICNCDPERSYPICEECINTCHKKKGHHPIKSYMADSVCMCGIRCHQLSNDIEGVDRNYQRECLFCEWNYVSNLNIYYSHSNNKDVICVLCYNICYDRKSRDHLIKKSINTSQPQVRCTCSYQNHDDVRILIRKLKSIAKKNNFLSKYSFEGFTVIHFINLLTLGKESYYNIFHSFDDEIANTFQALLSSSSYLMDKLLEINDLLLTSTVLSQFALKCSRFLYLTDKFKTILSAPCFFRIIEKKFDFKNKNIWELKLNLTNIFYKFYIKRDFSFLPSMKIRDIELLHPLQRYVLFNNIKAETRMIEYVNNFNFNLLDCTISMINRVDKAEKKREGYIILYRLYQIIEILCKFSLVNYEQVTQLCELNDNVISRMEKSIKNDYELSELTYFKIKVLSPIAKSMLYIAYYYNDQLLVSYLKGEKVKEQIHFFHSNSHISKYLSRNAINILTLIRHLNSREAGEEENATFIDLQASRIDFSKYFAKREDTKLVKKIVEHAYHVISLVILNPDSYGTGMSRLFHKNQQLFLKLTENNFEKPLVQVLRYHTDQLEQAYTEFYSNYIAAEANLVAKCLDILTEITKYIDINRVHSSNFRDLGSVFFDEYRSLKSLNSVNNSNSSCKDFVVLDKDNKKVTVVPKSKTIRMGNVHPESNSDLIRKNRIVINKSYFIFSLIKVIHILHDYHVGIGKPSKSFEVDSILFDEILTFFQFFIKDNPDNSMSFLISDFTSAIELLSGDQLLGMMNLLQSAIQNIFIAKYEITSNANILHLIKFISRKAENSSNYLSILEKVIKVIHLLIQIPFIEMRNTQAKLRKIIKDIYKRNPVFHKYVKNIQGSVIDFDNKTVGSIFKKILRIINHLFTGNETVNETEFLMQILDKDEILVILSNISLDLQLRTEVLKFFRLVHIDILLDPSKGPIYRSILIDEPTISISSGDDNQHDERQDKIYETLIDISRQDISAKMDFQSSVLLFELKSFKSILEANPEAEKKKKLDYVEHGIIYPLSIFLRKVECMIFNIPGSECLNAYEMVFHFLKLKIYIMTHKDEFEFKQFCKFKNFFKNKLSIFGTYMKHFICWDFTKKDIYEAQRDLTELEQEYFEFSKYDIFLQIFKRHLQSFICLPKLKDLKGHFDKRPYSYSPSAILEKEKKLKKYKMLTTHFTQNVFQILIKYHNDKNNFDESSFISLLEEDNAHFDMKYRFLLVRNALFLMSNSLFTREYRDVSLGVLFRLLQYDTVATQKVCWDLYKNGSKLLDFSLLIDNFTSYLISLFLKKITICISVVSIDYFLAIVIIKIFKYFCEEHNVQFQSIFLKELKVQYEISNNTQIEDQATPQASITFFNFLLSVLSKIILMSNWDTIADDSNICEFYYDIFSVIIELLIETIQGTEKENLDMIFSFNHSEGQNIFDSFLCTSKHILLNEEIESKFYYRIRNDLMNFIMAFLEENATPLNVINAISSVISPISVIECIVLIMSNLYLKLPQSKKQPFNKDINDYFTREYFGDPNFCQNEEFALANTMYQYFKLLAIEKKYKNENASALFTKIRYTKEDDLEANDESFNMIYWCVKFFEKITRTVYVNRGTTETEPCRVLFTINPLLPILSNQSRLDFLQNVDRSDRYVKLFSLMENCEYFYDEIKYNETRAKRNTVLRLIGDINFYWLEVLSFIITLAINGIMIFRWNGIGQASMSHKGYSTAIEILAICNTALNGLFISMWLYCKFLLVYMIERKKYMLNKRHGKKMIDNANTQDIQLRLLQKITVLYNVLIARNELTSFIWNIIFSSQGLESYDAYFLFSVQMLIVMNLSETIWNIIRSLTLKSTQLIATAICVVIVCYIFSSVAFFYLSEDFIVTVQAKPPNSYPEHFSFLKNLTGEPITDTGDVENECGTLLYCFATHLDYGLRTDGGIGEHLPKRSFTRNPSYYVIRMIYNLLYFIIVVVILLSVVFGVVIDAFAELRDRSQRVDFDKKNICFICGVTRESLEKSGEKFDEHTENDHNIWTYVDYIIGLKFIDKQETNAINSYVIEEVNKKQIGWIPSSSLNEGERNMNEDVKEVD